MPQNVDVRGWIGAGADCPDDVFAIRWIDIVVDYDGVSIHQRARLALRRNRRRLNRVARVLLLNAGHDPHAAGPCFRDPYAFHSGDSCFAQRPFDDCRA